MALVAQLIEMMAMMMFLAKNMFWGMLLKVAMCVILVMPM